MTNIRAHGGWVLIKPDAPQKQTSSGIIIPNSVTEYGHTTGTVLNASDTYYTRDKNVLTEMPVSSGDRVMYRDYLKELETVEINGDECCFIYIEDIVLILESVDG